MMSEVVGESSSESLLTSTKCRPLITSQRPSRSIQFHRRVDQTYFDQVSVTHGCKRDFVWSKSAFTIIRRKHSASFIRSYSDT